jgi:hypothetical protein
MGEPLGSGDGRERVYGAAIAAINTVLNFTLKTLVITVATMSPFPATTGARCDPRWCARRGSGALSGATALLLVHLGGGPPRARGRTAAPAHGMAAPPPTQSGVVSGALSILDARDAGGSSRTRIPSV